ncbi:MAG: hypothetical protein K2O44_00310 [Clostridia bacterium]|nr:hypothetical protein [Clostridia bacterium]
MIKFDGAKTTTALERRRIYRCTSIMFFVALIIYGVIIATCSKYAESNWELYLAFLCVYIMAVLSFVFFLIFFGAKPGKELNHLVCKTIAEAFYDREDILKGNDIRFTVNYSGDVLTLSREGYTGEIIISPASFKNGNSVADGGAEISFDLSALKTAPSVYSSAGEKLLQFLQAYYLVNAQRLNADGVTVTDDTGGAPRKIILVADGKPVAAGNNYFIKRGLIND